MGEAGCMEPGEGLDGEREDGRSVVRIVAEKLSQGCSWDSPSDDEVCRPSEAGERAVTCGEEDFGTMNAGVLQSPGNGQDPQSARRAQSPFDGWPERMGGVADSGQEFDEDGGGWDVAFKDASRGILNHRI
jgi:hypothetical protein